MKHNTHHNNGAEKTGVSNKISRSQYEKETDVGDDNGSMNDGVTVSMLSPTNDDNNNKRYRMSADDSNTTATAAIIDCSTNNSSRLTMLPSDTMFNIFTYLDYLFLIRSVSTVSTQLRELVYSKDCWKAICMSPEISTTTSAESLSSSASSSYSYSGQVITLSSNSVTVLKSAKHILPMLQIPSIHIRHGMSQRIAIEYLRLIEPHVRLLTIEADLIPPTDLQFPNLISFTCRVNEKNHSKDLVSMYVHKKSQMRHLSVNNVANVHNIHEFDNCLKSLCVAEVNDLDKLVEQNTNSLESLSYKVIEYIWTGPFEKCTESMMNSFISCKNLKRMLIRELHFHSQLTYPGVVLENLVELELKASPIFIKQFFSVQHPKLTKLTMCLYEIDTSIDLSTILPLEHLTELLFYIAEHVDPMYLTQLENQSRQFLSKVNPRLSTLGVASGSPLPLEFFTRFTNLKDVRFLGVGTAPIIPDLLKHNKATVESVFIGYMEDIGPDMWRHAENLQSLALHQTSWKATDINPIIEHHTKLKQVVLNFQLFEHPLPQNISLKSVSTEVWDTDGDSKFHLLPRAIRDIELRVCCDLSVQEWILIAICCHHAEAFTFFDNDFDFPIFSLVDPVQLGLFGGFEQAFIYELGQQALGLISSQRIIMTNEEREAIRSDYELIFKNEQSFFKYQHYFSALSALCDSAKMRYDRAMKNIMIAE